MLAGANVPLRREEHRGPRTPRLEWNCAPLFTLEMCLTLESSEREKLLPKVERELSRLTEAPKSPGMIDHAESIDYLVRTWK